MQMITKTRRLLRDSAAFRNAVAPVLARTCSKQRSGDWLIILMYHDIQAAEQVRLGRQLQQMKTLGDFTSLNDAVDLLQGNALGGRYLCITIDDGYDGAFRYGFPVFQDCQVPTSFFVVPEWLDQATAAEATPGGGDPIRYMSWNACRFLSQHGATVGSHSQGHRRFSKLSPKEALFQMEASRRRITQELGTACHHFACPWGQPEEDYLSERDPEQARNLGYRSFLTTIGLPATSGTDPFRLPRIRVEPGWSATQLRYVFFRN